MVTRIRLWLRPLDPRIGAFVIERTIEGRPHPDCPALRDIELETGAIIEACQNLGPVECQ